MCVCVLNLAFFMLCLSFLARFQQQFQYIFKQLVTVNLIIVMLNLLIIFVKCVESIRVIVDAQSQKLLLVASLFSLSALMCLLCFRACVSHARAVCSQIAGSRSVSLKSNLYASEGTNR